MVSAELLWSPYFAAALFFLVAFTYSSVGLGGGSSYTALMAILQFDALAIPMISLTLNLFVTSVGSYNFIRRKHARLRLIVPFLVSSIPMAYLGGSLKVPKTVFYWILLISLCFVAIRIYLWDNTAIQLRAGKRVKVLISLFAGGILGLLAGIVGIGGGIYLVPLILILGLGSEKEAAACGAVFIWVNSASGLIGRLRYNPIDLAGYVPLIIAVVAGAAVGSCLGASRFSARTMEKILGLVIVVAIGLLLKKMTFT